MSNLYNKFIFFFIKNNTYITFVILIIFFLTLSFKTTIIEHYFLGDNAEIISFTLKTDSTLKNDVMFIKARKIFVPPASPAIIEITAADAVNANQTVNSIVKVVEVGVVVVGVGAVIGTYIYIIVSNFF